MQNNILDNLAVFGANYLLFILVLIAAVYFFKLDTQKKKEIAIFDLVTMPLAYLWLWLISLGYNDPRPFVVGNFTPLVPHSPDNGFPSDHAALSSAIAMTVFYFNRKLGLSLLMISILISTSRVYAGVHHPIDVIGSTLSAIITSYLVFHLIQNRLVKKLSK